MTRDELQQLSWQLARLPGGAAAAVPDFFARLLAEASVPGSADYVEAWSLRSGGLLGLRLEPGAGALYLVHAAGQDALAIAALPPALLEVARADGCSALVLALLAIASGQVDDGRRLKRRLPEIDGAAKDLMLMTVCRLCG